MKKNILFINPNLKLEKECKQGRNEDLNKAIVYWKKKYKKNSSECKEHKEDLEHLEKGFRSLFKSVYPKEETTNINWMLGFVLSERT